MKWYKIIILFYFLCYVPDNSFAQPVIQWQKTYGGSDDDFAQSVCLTNQNGFVIVGTTNSNNGDVHLNHGDADVWLINIDSLGSLIWKRCLGGTGDDKGYSIVKTYDNGFIIAGETGSDDGDVFGLHSLSDNDWWIVKTDSNGLIQWQKCIGGPNFNEAYKIIQTKDSGYLVTGYVTNNGFDVSGFHGFPEDCWVVKLDNNGSIQWSKAFGGSDAEEGQSLIQTQDEGYLILGWTSSNDGDVTGLHSSGSSDAWVIKLDSTGQLIWQKCYGGSSADQGWEVISASNGGFYIIAETLSNDGDVTGYLGNDDMWVIRIDSIGNTIWNKCYGGNSLEYPREASATSDGGIVMIGAASLDDSMVTGSNGFVDYWVVKIDSLGNFLWGKCLGGSDADAGLSVLETNDEGYLAVGSTQSTNGDVTFNHGGYDFWVVKLAPLGLQVSELQNTLMDLNISQNNDELTLRFFSKQNENAKLFLYDLTGKQIVEKSFSVTEGINYSQINCGGIAKGMYFVKIDGENNSQMEKVFIE